MKKIDMDFSNDNMQLQFEILEQCMRKEFNPTQLRFDDVFGTDLDFKMATDVRTHVDKKIIDVGLRIRKDDCKFRDLTVRVFNKGYETEIHKLIKGYGDRILYVWLLPDGTYEYIYIDLHKLRAHVDNILKVVQLNKSRHRQNTDGTTALTYITLEELQECKALIGYKLRKFWFENNGGHKGR